nr:MAG TPA: hypothetical protein [Caudoviricetes sp.]
MSQPKWDYIIAGLTRNTRSARVNTGDTPPGVEQPHRVRSQGSTTPIGGGPGLDKLHLVS